MVQLRYIEQTVHVHTNTRSGLNEDRSRSHSNLRSHYDLIYVSNLRSHYVLIYVKGDVGTSRPLGARRVKISPSWHQTWLQEGEIFFSSFEMGEPSLAPRRVKICPPGAKLGSRRVKFFFQVLIWGSQVWLPGGWKSALLAPNLAPGGRNLFFKFWNGGAMFGSHEGENLPSWRQTWLQEGEIFFQVLIWGSQVWLPGGWKSALLAPNLAPGGWNFFFKF